MLRFRPLLARAPREIFLPALVLIANAAVGIEDIFEDRAMGLSISHYGAEAFVSFLGLLTAAWLMKRMLESRGHIRVLHGQLSDSALKQRELEENLAHWKAESSRLVDGLSLAIEHQFSRWGLSHAEGEIALLLLKGLSTKEIAEQRQVSDRTVRQQSVSVYDKAGLDGRAALSAFFLEDLLAPGGDGMHFAQVAKERAVPLLL